MKLLTKTLQALLGAAALACIALLATGRLALRTINKRCGKFTKRCIAALLIVVPTGFAILFAYVIYESKYGRIQWDNEDISEYVEKHNFRDRTIRVYNKESRKYTTPKILWTLGSCSDDSLTVYAIPHKRGYINTYTGEIVIDAQKNNYSKAWIFSEGKAAVVKGGKIGFINHKNEMVIPPIFSYNEKTEGCIFKGGYCTIIDEKGNAGLIDHFGDWAVEPVYDQIYRPSEGDYRIVVKDGKYGLLGPMLDIMYPTEYDKIQTSTNGIILTKDGRKWQVDFNGNITQSLMFDATYYLKYPVDYNEEGYINYAFANYLKYCINDTYGIMNRITGKPVTPALYLDINMLAEDLFEVQDAQNYNWFLIDSKGNRIQDRQ